MSKTSALIGKDNPQIVTASYRYVSGPVASVIMEVQEESGRPWERIAGIFRRLGDLVFMASDEEAYWRGWTIQSPHAGLGRRYRDPRFDTLAQCPQCRGLGTTATGSGPGTSSVGSRCVNCPGTGRVVTAPPPFPHDG